MDDNPLQDILNLGKNWTGEKKEEGEEEDMGPCASRATPKGWPALIVKNARNAEKKEQGWRGFQYCHLGFAIFAPDGLSIGLEFNEPEKWRVLIKGRNFARLFTNLVHHKIEWLTRVDRDFGHDDKPVITEIVIDRVAEE